MTLFNSTDAKPKATHRMKTSITVILLLLAACVAGSAQAVRFDTNTYTTNGSCVSGAQCPVLAIPGATVKVCMPPNCTALATTYTNSGAGTACATNAQLTPVAGGACLATSDAQGNAGFWILPGSYNYYITLPNGGATYGPYPISVGAATGCPSGFTCDQNYATLALACSAAGSGTLFVSVAWNGLATQPLACNTIWGGAGRIQPASGQTVTFSTCPGALLNQQIFDLSVAGATGIALPSTCTASTGWFGSNGTAVQAAFNSGANRLAGPCSTFAFGSTTVTIPATSGLNVDFSCSTFTYTATGTAFDMAEGGLKQSLYLGTVQKTVVEWPSTDSSSIGVHWRSSGNSVMRVVVSNFWHGLDVDGTVSDNSNNQLLPGSYFTENKISLYARGTVTNNQYYSFNARINGGSPQCPTPGTPISGTKLIHLSSVGPRAGINNNDFYSAEIQDDTCAEFVAYLDGASTVGNKFWSPRLESTLYNGIFTLTSTTSSNEIHSPFLSSGNCSTGNEISDLSLKNIIYAPSACDFQTANAGVPFRVVRDRTTPATVFITETAGAVTDSDGLNLGASGRPCTVSGSDATGNLCGKGLIHMAGNVQSDAALLGATSTVTGAATVKWTLCTGATPTLNNGSNVWGGAGRSISGSACAGTITIGAAPSAGSLRMDFSAAPTLWVCTLQNLTSQTAIPQTVTGSSQCNFKTGLVSAADILVYTATPQ